MFKSIKLKLLFISVSAAITALSLTLGIMLYQAEQQFTLKLNEKRNILENYVDLLPAPLWNFNEERVASIISTMMLDQDILQVNIEDEGGAVVAGQSADAFNDSDTSELVFPIVYSNAHISQTIGTARIILGKESFLAERKQFIFSGFFSLFFIIISLTCGIWLVFSRLIDKPLKALTDAIRMSNREDSFAKVAHQSNDELGVISEAFNEMQTSLESHYSRAVKDKDHLQNLYHSTPSLLFSFDENGIIRDASNYFLSQLNFKQEDVIGSHLYKLLDMENREDVVRQTLKSLWSMQQLSEYSLRIIDGNNQKLDVLMDATLSASDSFPGALAVITDVTSLNQAKRKLEHLANTDQLSGIANRYSFQNYLARLTHDRRQKQASFALLYIDLNHFKSVNDTYGHHVGDKLLRLVTKRIQGVLRSEDIIARLGGDEFAVILENLPSDTTAAGIGQQIVQQLEQSFMLEKSKIYISASVGIAMYPEDSRSPSELLQFADLAMYRAKEDSHSSVSVFSDDHNKVIQKRFKIENLLRKSIQNDLLEIHYQPIICLQKQKIAGVEALLRLKDEDGNIISPAEFIPVAEESGLIVNIGEWCIQQSCLQLAAWQQQFDQNLYLSVNVSPRQFQAQSFYSALASAISDAGVNADSVMIEITESLMLHDNQNNLSIFKQLESLGCRIAIDDFGTGYSALSYLMKFPLSVLKIDRSFISEDSEENLRNGLVTAIIQMGASMKLKVIAEGIETEEQLLMLKGLSQELSIQGYFFAKPMQGSLLEQKFEALNLTAKAL